MLREPIATAWSRARHAGLMTDAQIPETRMLPVDRESRFSRAAVPVVAELAAELAEGEYALVLADRDAVIVDRRVRVSRLGNALDGVFAAPGFRFAEESTGTNAIATVLETGCALRVDGTEHYLETLHRFSCSGQPVRHPVTGRLLGVLDLTCYTAAASPLMHPLLARAVRDIELRLLSDSPSWQQRMLAAFQARAARVRSPVVALGDGVIIANAAAHTAVSPALHEALAVEFAARGHGVRLIDLGTNGDGDGTVEARFSAIEGAPGAVLIELPGAATARPAIPRSTAALRRPGPPSSGSQGTGLLQRAEFDAIITALAACEGNKAHAATLLGIGRTTLYRRMRELGVPRQAATVPERNS